MAHSQRHAHNAGPDLEIPSRKAAKPLATIALPSSTAYRPTDESVAVAVWSLGDFNVTVEYIRELAAMDISSDGAWYERLLHCMERELSKGREHMRVEILHAGAWAAECIQSGTELDKLAQSDVSIEIRFPDMRKRRDRQVTFACLASDLTYIKRT